jgi:hypothetical protein
MLKEQIRLKVIPEPDPDRRVVLSRPAGPGTALFTGSDPTAPDICCGKCGSPIITGMARTFVNFVFQCRNCGAFNDLTR